LLTLKTNHDASGFYDVKGIWWVWWAIYLKSTKPLPIIFKLVEDWPYSEESGTR